MAFTPYLIKRFDYTHENDFFRDFSLKLRSIYEDKPGLHVLIGNISCQGHQIDAIFIRSGQIMIIDFKDYSGKIEFSETNPWKLKRDNEPMIFVAGGAQCRNPFQQVSAYRYALLNFLNDNSEKVLAPNRNNIRWDHINTMVLFQREISFDSKQIPAKVNRFFTIADHKTVFNQLEDRNSPELQLSSFEVEAILTLLDVRAENIFNPDIAPIPNSRQDVNRPAYRIEQLRRFISGNNGQSEIKRALNFYRAIVEVERFKRPTVTQLFPFPINWATANEVLIINPVAQPKFNEPYIHNRVQQFAKNLFIGINVLIDGTEYPLFQTIILNTDIDDPQSVPFKPDSAELYVQTLEELGLQEDLIEELTTGVNSADSLQEKLKVVRVILGISAELTQTLALGLSTESLFTAQLLSELRKLADKNEGDFEGSIAKSFLLNQPITRGSKPFSFNPFIQVTPLNKSQEDAVQQAFNQPLTVITGPPGTGKSDVVLNIIANAIANDKSVLFASKNNKAVDCVSERFEKISSDNYFLRFGSKDELSIRTIPKITELINRTRAGNFNISEDTVKSRKDIILQKLTRVNELFSLLASMDSLQENITKQKADLDTLNIKYQEWKKSIDDELYNFFVSNNLEVKINIIKLNEILKRLQKLNSGFWGRLFFSIFYKGNIVQQVVNLNHSLRSEIQDYINIKAPYLNPDQAELDSLIANCKFISHLYLQCVEIKKQHSKQQTEIGDLEEALKGHITQYEQLVNSKPQHEQEITALKEMLPKLGRDFLSSLIHLKLHKSSIPALQSFKDFLPAHQLWQNNDLRNFKVACENFVKNINAISVTSLSIKNSFSLSPYLFDLLIIDEASQCDIASALPLLFRAKNAVIIGDPLQLKQITSVEKYEEDFVIEQYNLASNALSYTSKSLYDYAESVSNKSNFNSVFLDEHYRCHPDIIGFSKTYFYQVKMGQELKIRTVPENYTFEPLGVSWVNVNGRVEENKNVNIAEVNKAISIAVEQTRRYPKASIGIATPFKSQAEALAQAIPSQHRQQIKAGTVHSLQGDEKDIVILSLVVSTDCRDSLPRFINVYAPYLLNVATTRARSSLIIVGNREYCLGLRRGASKSLLCYLGEYVLD